MRRQLVYAVLACALGAGLALLAASRTWAVVVSERPPPLPPLRTAQSGARLAPWLPAVALVALAGAGALVATRGVARMVVGAVLGGCAVGIAAAGVVAMRAGGPVGWPLACFAATALVSAAAALTLRGARTWPSLGARYQRPTARRPDMWDALDRGEDPTR